ncbi:hypothetical protein B0H14DRAFT_3551100 [Mycena olivaceomarginata]|nr:hypothetical protein B0H14DRAFT_3551100 [Mycena olivaceomarginata]
MKTLNTYEEYGITPSYKTGHISENAYSNLKRKELSSVFVLALALTKDVEWRGSATKLERGCSSFIVFWETDLHSTRTDEGTAAETWLRWAGGFAAGAQSCNGCECSASEWTGACDTVLGGMDRKSLSALSIFFTRLRSDVDATRLKSPWIDSALQLSSLDCGRCVPSSLRGFAGA